MAGDARSIWAAAASQLAGSSVLSDAHQALQARDRANSPAKVDPAQQRQHWMQTAIQAVHLIGQGGFPGYAERHLKILNKSGELLPLQLNRSQVYVNDMAERQLSTRGYVRMLVPKARQLGISTYIGGRGYWKVTRKHGQKAYILAHEQKATDHLFGMIKRFYDNIPVNFRPHLARSNEQLLDFDRMSSGYSVGTARSGDTGRSLTAQFFHGSEVAFWMNAAGIVSGVLQTIGSVAGTEVWLESTANGIGNYFHTAVQMARKGESDFELAFCPWFWEPGYSTPEHLIPDDFEGSLSLEDLQYMQTYELTVGQMHWRAKKIAEFAAAEDGTREAGAFKFQQEYPATVEEAFLGENANAFIRAIVVQAARKAWRDHSNPRTAGIGPKIIGVDPSYTGPDKFTLWARQGRVAYKCGGWQKQKILVSLGRCISVFDREQPDQIFMDVGNIGGPLYELICEQSAWGRKITPVLFGDGADEPDRYYNKAAEMAGRTREWLASTPQVMLEDRDDIQADLTNRQTVRNAKPSQVKLESKDDMRKRGLPSPDDGDGLGLTFAYPADAAGARNAPDSRRSVTYGSGLSIRR
jgi:hypothetical protein